MVAYLSRAEQVTPFREQETAINLQGKDMVYGDMVGTISQTETQVDVKKVQTNQYMVWALNKSSTLCRMIIRFLQTFTLSFN